MRFFLNFILRDQGNTANHFRETRNSLGMSDFSFYGASNFFQCDRKSMCVAIVSLLDKMLNIRLSAFIGCMRKGGG